MTNAPMSKTPMTKLVKIACTLLVTLTVGFTGCRGGTSHEPPVHLVQDMDFQPKVKAQSMSTFQGFADHRGMRLPVQDAFGKTAVVSTGPLPNPAYNHRDAQNAFVTKNPLPLNHKFMVRGREMSVIDRGRESFDIHCAICHGYTGQGGNDPKQGHGLVGRRWKAPIPNFHFVAGENKDNRVASMADGEYFEVITHGKGTMPAYGPRLSVEERWAIVHYVRALQSLSK